MANLDGTSGDDVLSGTSDDDIINGFEGNDDLNGGDGNDTLIGGSGTNVLFGGGGNDLIYVDGVDDVATGGIGDDTIHVGFYLGAATILGGGISGGSGTDTLVFNDATFDPTSAAARFSGFESVSGTIHGTAGNDELYLNLLSGAGIEASLLTINCGDGDDFVAAGSEIDVIHGGDGNDRLGGGIGNDTLYGEAGNDELNGGEGNNTLYGGDGNDILTTGGGTDVLYSGSGSNNLYAGFGNDILYADGIDDIVNGGAGNDVVHIGSLAGAAAILGGAVTGGTETDSLTFNNATFDPTSGSASFVQFEAVAGTLSGTTGNDVLNLAGLTDAALATSQLTINGGDGNDTVTGGAEIDRISGQAGDDVLAGGGNADRLHGGDGTDTLNGGAGDDVLIGGTGDDTMAGGLGDDLFYVDAAGDETIEAVGAGWDVVRAGVDYVLGDNVEELFIGGAARDGTGNALANTLHGSGSSNTLAGLAGDDILRGLGGRDTLLGGDGDDLIDGGVGKDTMTGGADRDVFQFRDGDMGPNRSLADVITDFSHADAEKIHLQLIDANTTVGGNQALTWIGNGAFTGVAGQLHYAQQAGTTYVEGDTNGDGTADFAIALTGLLSLVASDFVL